MRIRTRDVSWPRAFMAAFAIIAMTGFVGCMSAVPRGEIDSRISLSEMDVVDCVVEGAVRMIGSRFTYQEPPRMARLTEFECASLGGTFVLFDPTNPNAVIEKWLPIAEQGDITAQHRLGLLYEGVMGADPDYEKAARWYGEAAKKGHRESMFALSVLYEKGLGVDRDIVRSINLYREASGMEGDSIMFSSDAYQQIEQLKTGLAKEISDVSAQRDALESQVASLRSEAKEAGSKDDSRVATLSALVAQLEGQVSEKEVELASLPSYRLLSPQDSSNPTQFDFPALPTQVMRDRRVGKFYALVIGNNNYEKMPNLKTAHNDAKRISEVLTNQFGFSTQLLLDANEEEIKRAIYNLNNAAGENDNLLIYFAGHGQVKEAPERARRNGYWLPTNADEDQDVNWIDNWWVTNHLDASKVRRALIIADSCYGGVFSTDLPIGPVTKLPPLTDDDLDQKLDRKSRFVLASGGNDPVLDSTNPGDDHSVFANAFLGVLSDSTESMSIVELYGRVFDRMYSTLSGMGLNQEPELRVIRAAGHQSEGDFFFLRN